MVLAPFLPEALPEAMSLSKFSVPITLGLITVVFSR